MNDEELIEAMMKAYYTPDERGEFVGMRAALAVVREAWGKDAERLNKLEQALLHGNECLASYCATPDECREDYPHPHFEVFEWGMARPAVGQSLRATIDDIDAARAQEKQ